MTPRVDQYIDALPDWQQAICHQVRELVHAADLEVQETIKRKVQPYFVLQGNICALLATRDHVNVFLYDGAIVPDPEGNHHRRPRQQDSPDGRHLRRRTAQRHGAAHDVRADHRRQPRRRMAPAQTRGLNASRRRLSRKASAIDAGGVAFSSPAADNGDRARTPPEMNGPRARFHEARDALLAAPP